MSQKETAKTAQTDGSAVDSGAYTTELLMQLEQAAGGQSALAAALDISRAAIWKWWQKQEIPLSSLPVVIAFAQGVGLTVDVKRLHPHLFTTDVIAAL